MMHAEPEGGDEEFLYPPRSLGFRKTKPKGRCLKLRATLRGPAGFEQDLTVLIDTGAEVNLVRKGLLPDWVMQPVEKPMKFTTASSERLEGGKRQVVGTLHFQGVDPDTKSPQGLNCPITFYEAATTVDAILSYGWLAECNFLVNPQRHGIVYHDERGMVWLEGLHRTGIPVMLCSKATREGVSSPDQGQRPDQGANPDQGPPVTPPNPSTACWTCSASQGAWGMCSGTWDTRSSHSTVIQFFDRPSQRMS